MLRSEIIAMSSSLSVNNQICNAEGCFAAAKEEIIKNACTALASSRQADVSSDAILCCGGKDRVFGSYPLVVNEYTPQTRYTQIR